MKEKNRFFTSCGQAEVEEDLVKMNALPVIWCYMDIKKSEQRVLGTQLL